MNNREEYEENIVAFLNNRLGNTPLEFGYITPQEDVQGPVADIWVPLPPGEVVVINGDQGRSMTWTSTHGFTRDKPEKG